jgi:hypothetical protein
VGLPFLTFLVGGPGVAATLSRVRDWLVVHNKTVSAVVLGVIAVIVITNGVSIVRG